MQFLQDGAPFNPGYHLINVQMKVNQSTPNDSLLVVEKPAENPSQADWRQSIAVFCQQNSKTAQNKEELKHVTSPLSVGGLLSIQGASLCQPAVLQLKVKVSSLADLAETLSVVVMVDPVVMVDMWQLKRTSPLSALHTSLHC